MMICPFKKEHRFAESNKAGSKGEATVIEWLNSADNVKRVTDVSDDKKWQEKDVDLLVLFDNGRMLKMEVKTDSYKTGNFFYETISNKSKGSSGCFEYTDADFIIYYYSELKILYLMETKKLRRWFHLYKPRLEKMKKEVVNKYYKSEGYAIPIRMIKKHDWVKEYKGVGI